MWQIPIILSVRLCCISCSTSLFLTLMFWYLFSPRHLVCDGQRKRQGWVWQITRFFLWDSAVSAAAGEQDPSRSSPGTSNHHRYVIMNRPTNRSGYKHFCSVNLRLYPERFFLSTLEILFCFNPEVLHSSFINWFQIEHASLGYFFRSALSESMGLLPNGSLFNLKRHLVFIEFNQTKNHSCMTRVNLRNLSLPVSLCSSGTIGLFRNCTVPDVAFLCFSKRFLRPCSSREDNICLSGHRGVGGGVYPTQALSWR